MALKPTLGHHRAVGVQVELVMKLTLVMVELRMRDLALVWVASFCATKFGVFESPGQEKRLNG